MTPKSEKIRSLRKCPVVKGFSAALLYHLLGKSLLSSRGNQMAEEKAQWLGGVQRTRAQCTAPMVGSSQAPATQAPGNRTPFTCPGIFTHVNGQLIHMLLKNKSGPGVKLSAIDWLSMDECPQAPPKDSSNTAKSSVVSLVRISLHRKP